MDELSASKGLIEKVSGKLRSINFLFLLMWFLIAHSWRVVKAMRSLQRTSKITDRVKLRAVVHSTEPLTCNGERWNILVLDSRDL